MYIRKTWVAGKTVETKKTYSARYGKKLPRGDKIRDTPEAQERGNTERAIAELRRILNANFAPGDWHAVFTYPQETPPTPQEAERDRAKLIKRMRALYHEHGIELKVVSVTEYKRKRIHHHLVINKLPNSMLPVKRLWKEIVATTYYTPEQQKRGEPLHLRFPWSMLDDSGQYSELAHYLIKETDKSRKDKDAARKRRYTCSRNLIRPQPKVEIISAAKFRDDPPERKGYYIDKKASWNGYSDVTGMPVQETVYVQLTTVPAKKRRRRTGGEGNV